MNANELLVSSVHITEDEYCYKGLFILSNSDKSMNVDLAEFEGLSKIEEIKSFFNLEDSNDIIKKVILENIMDKASLSSKI